MGLIHQDSKSFHWRTYSSVNVNADGAVIIADPDDPSKPLREKRRQARCPVTRTTGERPAAIPTIHHGHEERQAVPNSTEHEALRHRRPRPPLER